MKIGIDTTIINVNQAGTGTYARSLLDALRTVAPGNSYNLLSGSPRRNMSRQKTVLTRVETIYRDLIWTHALLPWQANRAGVNLLHIPSGIGPLWASCPQVVTILDTIILQFPQNFNVWHRNYSRIFLPLSARAATRILTISEQSKRDIIKYLKVPPNKIAVTYLAASPIFRPVEKQAIQEVKRHYQLDKFILTVGTLEPRKNLHRLLGAFASLKQRGYQLIHVGPKGWKYDDIILKIEQLGLNDMVRFLGYVPMEDLVALYNAASVFVYPSLYEGFGLPILEAMSCNCPVITSNMSSMPEVAGDAALLIDPFDEIQITEAIQTVLDDTDMADKMRYKGLARASMFSWQRCAEETLRVYQQACGQV